MESILVVDDEKNIRITIGEFLKDRGYQAILAESASQAIESLRSQKIDLVISDIMMPGMTGTELLAHIQDNYPEIKTILITGQASLENAATALRGGAFDYLQKPISKNELLTVIENALEVIRLDRKNRLLLDENTTQCQKLEDRIHQKTEKLSRLSQRLITVRDDERKEIAREIEKSIGQSLIALKLELQSSFERNQFLGTEKIISQFDEIISRIRHLADSLDPLALADTDLRLIVNQLKEEFSNQDLTRITIQGPESLKLGSSSKAYQIGLIIREAVSNALRHGKPSLISIRLESNSEQVLVTIKDDGKGFASQRLEQDVGQGIGLLLMRERTNSLGGQLTIQSIPGRGTEVRLEIPD